MWAVMAMIFVFTANVGAVNAAPDNFAEMAAKLSPAVVNISTSTVIEGRPRLEIPQLPPGSPFEDFFKDFFDRNQQQKQRKATALGSGFIISKEGYVVTNNHVIRDADEVTVILQDNTKLKAEVIGTDQKTDLAVLKVKSDKPLSVVSFGPSGADVKGARVGDWVLAIGNPFGLGGTVTAGIISARGRDIRTGPYDDYIQTDASINSGNSGGPLFNMQGQVIGINTAIYSPNGGSIGIGFSIPSSTAEPVIRQLIDNGQVRRGWLGVHIQKVTEDIAQTLGLKKATGALVANVVEDGPAAKAGLKPSDVITEFNGQKVSTMRELPRIVAATPVGKSVNVKIWRKRKMMTVNVSVGELPEQSVASKNRSPGSKAEQKPKTVSALGLTVAALTDNIRQKYKISDDAEGVVVTDVDPAGPAAEKGLRPGVLLVEISQQAVSSPADVRRKVNEAKKAGLNSVLLLMQDQTGSRFVAIRLKK